MISCLTTLLNQTDWQPTARDRGTLRLTLTPSVFPNSNNVIVVSDWNCLKYFCVCCCTVIIRCIETFWSPCTFMTCTEAVLPLLYPYFFRKSDIHLQCAFPHRRAPWGLRELLRLLRAWGHKLIYYLKSYSYKSITNCMLTVDYWSVVQELLASCLSTFAVWHGKADFKKPTRLSVLCVRLEWVGEW
jgi:hypothetical protein